MAKMTEKSVFFAESQFNHDHIVITISMLITFLVNLRGELFTVEIMVILVSP